MCTAFKHHSSCLCNSLALVAKKLSTRHVNPVGITAFTSSRLKAIDKQPGVRPIAIGELPRRIISKAILSVVRLGALEIAGSVLLCAGQEAGCKTAVHAMRAILEGECTQTVILVNAQNAFNLLNQQLALLNIHRICPSITPVLTNLYRRDANMYVQIETVQSNEEVMQSDPLAMAMFALGVTPLIRALKTCYQIWFADDASAGGTLEEVHQWWVKLLQIEIWLPFQSQKDVALGQRRK